MKREDVFRAIRAERKRQDKLHPGDKDFSAAEWEALLAEECGEAVKELNALQWGEPGHTNEMLVTELVHTASLAVRILETLRHAEIPENLKALQTKPEAEPELREKPEPAVEEPEPIPEVEKAPTQEKPENRPYQGFVHLRCDVCGAAATFCSKLPLRYYKCRFCGAVSMLGEKTMAVVDCKCGKKAKYQTNIEDYSIEIPCGNCGQPNDLIYNPRRHRFEPPEYGHSRKGVWK